MNRQCYPSALFPLRGDISAEAGAISVTVKGLQTVPVAAITPTDQQVLTYVAVNSDWEPSSVTSTQANKSIQVNGVVVSDDYDIGVNLPLGISNSPTLVNGS